jgi:di/tricarboxylate transporter
MTASQAIVFAGLAVLIVELVRGRRSPAAVFASIAFAFVLLDYLPLKTSLEQFTNTGLVTVVVLLLLSVVLDKSRLLEQVAERLVSGPYRPALARLYLATCAYSAFLNNTAVVASLLGPLRMSRQHAPSRLLLPMCYAATLGGTLTLVGTSTNLLVNSLMVGRGMPALQIFDLFPVGLLIVLGCGITMLATYPSILKAQPPNEETGSEYFLEATVRPDSKLVGKTVEANGLRKLAHLFLTEIVRDGRVVAPVEPDTLVRAGDLLVFTGDLTRLDLLLQFDGLVTKGQHYELPLDNLVEVVIASNSTLARRTIKEVDFRSQFDAAVIAVRRGSERLAGTIANIPLEVGDTLVLVVGKDFEKRNNLGRNFVIVKRSEVQKFTDARKGLVALAGFVGVIALSAFGVVDFLKALLVLLALFLVLGYAKTSDLRRNMPYQIILIIASALIISEVMITTGAAELLAGALLRGAEGFGPYWALAVILVVTWILTELMSNNAAAALAFPVALGVAAQLGLDAKPFVMAALYGASCSFVTPYGYQTNLMVMSPGRYALADYVRAGLPVALVFMAVCLLAIPVVFPFTAAR